MAEESSGEGSQKRQIALKARIRDILGGRFVQEEGWSPNYVEADDGRRISRINLIGAVVDKEESSIVVEDGTGKISARVFGDEIKRLDGVDIGDVALVIGRPREYGGERYILLEIVKKIEDKKWIDVRNMELGKLAETPAEKKEEAAVNEAEEKVEEEVIGEEEKTTPDKIIEFVKSKDSGDGVDFEDILKEFNDEAAVKNLLSEGELFEIRPGRLKVLE